MTHDVKEQLHKIFNEIEDIVGHYLENKEVTNYTLHEMILQAVALSSQKQILDDFYRKLKVNEVKNNVVSLKKDGE